MASRIKERGTYKDGKRSKDDGMIEKGGMRDESPVSINGDLDDGPQLWIHTPEEEPSSSDKDRKRITHNITEKQRKEKIKIGIAKLGHLLPRLKQHEKQSTLQILEQALDYIKEIREKNENLLLKNGSDIQAEEIKKLRKELEEVIEDRDSYVELLKNAGISTVIDPAVAWKGKKVDGVLSPVDCRPESADTTVNVPKVVSNGLISARKDQNCLSKDEDMNKSSKSKRRNTICAQLENIKNAKLQQLQQEIQKPSSSSSVVGIMNNMGNISGTVQAGMNQQLLASQNFLFNSMSNTNALLATGQNQMIFNPSNSAATTLNQGGIVGVHPAVNQNGLTFVSPQGNLLSGADKSIASDGAGLLQIAMRDAGITTVSQALVTQPSSGAGTVGQMTTHAGSTLVTSSSTSDMALEPPPLPQPTPLQTLASVASNTQSISAGVIGSSVPFLGSSALQQCTMAVTNTSQAINSHLPVMSVGQSGYNQLLPGGNTLINVPIVNPGNQSLPLGGTIPSIGNIATGLQTHQGQIVVLNDQGYTLMPSLQMGIDSASLALPSSSRQTLNQLPADKSTNKITALHVADQSKFAESSTMTLPIAHSQQHPQTASISHAISQQTPCSMQSIAYQAAPGAIIQQQQQQQQQQANQLTNHHQLLTSQFSGLANGGGSLVNSNQGLVLPVSQNGNLLTLNTVPAQPNQLPTALILPNGQIIPVVTQPQLILQQQQQQLQQQQLHLQQQQKQLQQQQIFNNTCQIPQPCQTANLYPSQLQAKLAVVGGLTGSTIDPSMNVNTPQGVPCSTQVSQASNQQRAVGLLMTTATVFQTSGATTSVASMNNNMVTTSATHSVMTTQVQSSQANRPTSAPAFGKRSDSQALDCKGATTLTTAAAEYLIHGNRQIQISMPMSNSEQSQVLGSIVPNPQTLLQSQVDTSVVSTALGSINSLPGIQPGQVIGPNGTILLTVSSAGQQTSFLVNPNTMQVYGTIPGQPLKNNNNGASTNSTINNTMNTGVAGGPNGNVAGTPATVTGNGNSGKKSGKKNSQRTIMPKPPKSSHGSAVSAVGSVNSTGPVSSSQAAVPNGLWSSISAGNDQEASSTSMQTAVSSSDTCITTVTTAESTIIQSPSTSQTTGTTDILAKAAESIFSNTLPDISPPISSFYNPANEDNPLHIDTSAGETEDDGSAQSPSKESSDGDNIPTSSRIEIEMDHQQSQSSTDHQCQSLAVAAAPTSTFFKDGVVGEPPVGAASKRGRQKSKDMNKLKVSMKDGGKKSSNMKRAGRKQNQQQVEITETIAFSDVLSSVDSIEVDKQKSPLKEASKKSSSVRRSGKKPIQQVEIPEEIIFTESELSDVLDQVESLKSGWSDETKRVKNRKSKVSSELESEQPTKKKKRGLPRDRDALMDAEQEIKVNSSECDNHIDREDNPSPFRSQLLSPDSTTTGKAASNYTPPSMDGSPPGEHMCDKTMAYDPYDITLALDEPSPVRSLNTADSSKSNNSSHISGASFVATIPSGKMSEKLRASPQPDIVCSTSSASRQIVRSVQNIVSSMSPAPLIGSANKTGKSRAGPLISQKNLNIACEPGNSVAENMLAKNSCTNRQMAVVSESVNSSNMRSSPRQQQQHCQIHPSTVPIQQSSASSAVSASITSSLSSIPNQTATPVDVSQNPANSSTTHIVSNTATETTYSQPNSLRYSAESLFVSPNKITVVPKSQPHVDIVQQASVIANNVETSSSASSKPRSGSSSIYSAENFVHSVRSDGGRPDKIVYSSGAIIASPNNGIPHMHAADADALSFPVLGLNVTPTSSSNHYPESLSSSASSSSSSSVSSSVTSACTSTSFTFSLSSMASSNSNNGSIFGSQVGHHHFPFYPLHPSVAPQQSIPHVENNDLVNPQQPQSFGLPSFGLNVPRNENPLQNQSNQTSNISSQSPSSTNNQSHNSFPFGIANNQMCISSRGQIGFSDLSRVIMSNASMEKVLSSNLLAANENVRSSTNQKQLSDITQNTVSIPAQPSEQAMSSGDCSAQITSTVSSYFPTLNYQSSQSLHTPPLHHPPSNLSDGGARSALTRSFNTNLSGTGTNFASSGQSFNTNRFPNNQLSFSSQRDNTGTQPLNHSNSQPADVRKLSNHQTSSSKNSKHQQQQQQQSLSQPPTQTQTAMSSHPQTHTSGPAQTQPGSLAASQPPPPPSRQTKQTSRTSKQSQSKKNKQQTFSTEVNSNLSQSIFEPNQSITTYFPIPNLSPPPPRNIQNEGPTFLTGNLFGSTARQISNSAGSVHKNAELSTFNSLFPSARPQNGLGLNFQTGFGMNTVHSAHSNTPQIPPHSTGVAMTPHVPNLSLSNIFSDVNSVSQSENLNISPIKFHTNAILPPQASMDPNSLQHHHQGSALYHNRPHPPPSVLHNAMSINSILGHNPHGFEARPVAQAINSTVAPPFHGPSHTTFPMPPLNFSMHEH